MTSRATSPAVQGGGDVNIRRLQAERSERRDQTHDDLIDRIAAEIGLQVADHIERMYPAATKAVAWNSAKRSIQGVIRNAVAYAGRAAEQGKADEWIKTSREDRRAVRAAWKHMRKEKGCDQNHP